MRNGFKNSEHPFIVGFRGFAYISDAQMTTMPDREHVHVRLLQPICTGSPAMRKTTGMFEVAVLAASAAAVGIVRMRATWRRTRFGTGAFLNSHRERLVALAAHHGFSTPHLR